MAEDLIPPRVRHRLAGLRLVTRRAVGRDGLGLHASRSRGAGLEFAQYRAYEPGDEPRQIDWKFYARSDRFFVREAERESPVALWILLDASGSMRQADGGGSRFGAATSLAACLGELALAGGDRFGWAVLEEVGLRVVPPANGSRQRDRLRRELAPIAPAGRFPEGARLGPLLERIGVRDLVIGLSDFFDPAMVDLLTRLADAGREVCAIQILTVAERDFSYDGGHRFRDPETGEELLGDAAAIRGDFLARFAEARAALAATFAARGVRHVTYVLDAPLDAPLRALFGANAG